MGTGSRSPAIFWPVPWSLQLWRSTFPPSLSLPPPAAHLIEKTAGSGQCAVHEGQCDGSEFKPAETGAAGAAAGRPGARGSLPRRTETRNGRPYPRGLKKQKLTASKTRRRRLTPPRCTTHNAQRRNGQHLISYTHIYCLAAGREDPRAPLAAPRQQPTVHWHWHWHLGSWQLNKQASVHWMAYCILHCLALAAMQFQFVSSFNAA